MAATSYQPANHTDPFLRPDIGLSDSARWCGICRHWDLGLIPAESGAFYRHRWDVEA